MLLFISQVWERIRVLVNELTELVMEQNDELVMEEIYTEEQWETEYESETEQQLHTEL